MIKIEETYYFDDRNYCVSYVEYNVKMVESMRYPFKVFGKCVSAGQLYEFIEFDKEHKDPYQWQFGYGPSSSIQRIEVGSTGNWSYILSGQKDLDPLFVTDKIFFHFVEWLNEKLEHFEGVEDKFNLPTFKKRDRNQND